MSKVLRDRVLLLLRGREGLGSGDPVVVAFSGGLDSSVLLHLIRFGRPDTGLRPVAAHFDHRMRAESGRDRVWCRGVAGAWAVEYRSSEASSPPRSEEEARRLRYSFLQSAKREVGARWILTAHHGDDQAETVLFRVLRGAGLQGLTGIAEEREDGVLRPLLRVGRRELEEYARWAGIRPLEDPTNRLSDRPRNVLRNEILPQVEKSVSPGARGALRTLAENARTEVEAGEEWSRWWLSWQGVDPDDSEVRLARAALLDLPLPARAQLLRFLLRIRGVSPSRAGTTAMMEFITTGRSGGSLDLQDGLSLAREFDSFVLRRVALGSSASAADSVTLEGDSGDASLTLRGRSFRARWRVGGDPGGEGRVARFRTPGAGSPYLVRGWRAGDRIRLTGGSKKLKKLFNQRRVPRYERGRIPLLAGTGGRILWAWGLDLASDGDPASTDTALWVRIAADDG